MGTETVLKVSTNENGADQNVSLISPIRLNVAYSMGWSALHGAETETHFLKMVANLRDKRTAIAIMPAKNRAFAIVPPPPLIFSLVPPFKFADFFLIRLALLNWRKVIRYVNYSIALARYKGQKRTSLFIMLS